MNEAQVIAELRDLAQRLDLFFGNKDRGPNTHTEAAKLLTNAAAIIEKFLVEKDK